MRGEERLLCSVLRLDAIAQKRGYLRKGGKPDYEKAGRALMQDYRSGLLGRITLETPP